MPQPKQSPTTSPAPVRGDATRDPAVAVAPAASTKKAVAKKAAPAKRAAEKAAPAARPEPVGAPAASGGGGAAPATQEETDGGTAAAPTPRTVTRPKAPPRGRAAKPAPRAAGTPKGETAKPAPKPAGTPKGKTARGTPKQAGSTSARAGGASPKAAGTSARAAGASPKAPSPSARAAGRSSKAAGTSAGRAPADPAPAPEPTSAAARDEALRANLASLRDLLAGGVVLTTQRLQEAVDEAVTRGRITRRDAEDLATSLVTAGRQQTADIMADLEQLLGRGRSDLTSARSITRGAVRGSSDRVLREVDKARRAAGIGRAYPILGYDELTPAQIRPRLKDLTPAELRKVRDYERGNANRAPVLASIEAVLA